MTVGLLLAGTLSVGADGTSSDIDWNHASPSQIHQQMANAKAAALAEKDVRRQMAAAAPQVNTQTDYDVRFYDIALRVNDTTETLYGVVKIVAAAAVDGVNQAQIDFHIDMTVDSIIGQTAGLTYTRNGNVVTVALGQTYNTGQVFRMTFFYHGHPTEGGFQAFAFDSRLGKPVISSLSEPYFARTWWPCKDRMDDKADSFNIAVTVDTSMYVGSNGTLDSTVSHGNNTHTFYWRVRYPMATYLFSVAISDYTVWYDKWVYNSGLDTMPLVHAVYSDLYDTSLVRLAVTPYALTVFSSIYGQYPFAMEKYGHANFEWGGAMEHQTMTSTAGTNFGFSEPVVVHEMSHQWWGDMITCESWGHVWLNESWASYSEAAYYYVKSGRQAYVDYMNGMAYTGGGTIFVEDTTSVWNIFDGNLSYDKASWVLHMLRGMLGDSLFFAGVNAYYHSPYQWGAATTEEFRDVFEQATGWDLNWYFQDWIYGEYRPNYQYRLYQEASDTGGTDVFLLVKQIQTTNPQVFHMPVQFLFTFPTLPNDTVTLWCNDRRKLFKFNFPENVSTVVCDPATWVLKYSSQYAWQLHLVTLNEELRNPIRYVPYLDTIEARGGSGFNTFSITAGTL